VKIAIIPARGGSKRIPKKNIKNFLGKPAIGSTIELLQDSDIFTNIFVSTDDMEIADIARSYGVEVPKLRPQQISDDTATTDSVVKHSLREATSLYGTFQYGCCIYPVNPLLQIEYLEIALKLMLNKKAKTCFSCVEFDFPIEQSFELIDARPRFQYPDKLDCPSQELPKYYHDAGMFYWFEVTEFLLTGKLISSKSVCFLLNQLLCQDINTIEDWALAELKVKRMRENDFPK
jgi:pseudaminic acid cytidylyltransferase